MSESSNSSLHALVFGASGITGWTTLKELLKYPTPATFSRVTGLTNRPLTVKAAHLPEDPRLQLFSGIDLQEDVSKVALALGKIPNIRTVTHIYYFAYKEAEDHNSLVKINSKMLEVAIMALEALQAPFKHVILQTGGKSYGVEYLDKVPLPPVPFKESTPRLPEPYASQIFYYAQVDILARLSANRPWTFTEVRPDAIIGFVPNHNAMNLAQILGVYLSLYRAMHGEGAEVPFPGTKEAYQIKTTDSSINTLVRFEIFASLNGGKTGNGEAFNVADSMVTFENKWPALASYFGLKGVPPNAANSPGSLEKWVKEHADVWLKLEKEHGLKPGAIEHTGWGFSILLFLWFDRPYDTTKMASVGFKETGDTVKGYFEAFDLYRKAKILP